MKTRRKESRVTPAAGRVERGSVAFAHVRGEGEGEEGEDRVTVDEL